MSAIIHEEYFPDFTTITCYNWERLIEREKEKEIIIESLRYLTKEKKVNVHAFVLMDNQRLIDATLTIFPERLSNFLGHEVSATVIAG